MHISQIGMYILQNESQGGGIRNRPQKKKNFCENRRNFLLFNLLKMLNPQKLSAEPICFWEPRFPSSTTISSSGYGDHNQRKFCPFCPQGFDIRCKKTLEEHLPLCRKYGGQKVIIPPKGKNIVEFTDHHKW